MVSIYIYWLMMSVASYISKHVSYGDISALVLAPNLDVIVSNVTVQCPIVSYSKLVSVKCSLYEASVTVEVKAKHQNHSVVCTEVMLKLAHC